MKNLLPALILIFGLGILTSCKKENQDNVEQQTATIKKNELFQYEFGLIGIEDNLYISRQARHFETSKLTRDYTGKIIYNYKPSLNYVGIDEVEISFGISNGSTVVKTSKTRIKIMIRN